MKELQGDSVLILGYGREGRETREFLARHYPSLRVGIADRPANLSAGELVGVECYQGEGYLELISRFDTIVRAPGVSRHLAEVSSALNGKHVTSATNLFFERCRGVTIGVTGTKGKSTTSALIADLLRSKYTDVRLAGNIGEPMLGKLETHTADTVFVLEISSFQLDDARYSPDRAVLLNILPEHLDYHGTFERYVEAKSNIFRHQREGQLLICNPEFPVIRTLIEESRRERGVIPTGDDPRFPGRVVLVRDGWLIARNEGGEERIVQLKECSLQGAGNVQNMVAAATVALSIGVPLEHIALVLRSFKPLAHRLESVGRHGGIEWVNDSLSTIPEALVHALDALGPVVESVIVGGHDRGLDYSLLGEALAQSSVRLLILLPTTGVKIRHAVESSNGATRIEMVDVTSLEEAVSVAAQKTSPGRACVLSPASSSFNMFRDYRERGERFAELCRAVA